jgi:hypothetical protein
MKYLIAVIVLCLATSFAVACLEPTQSDNVYAAAEPCQVDCILSAYNDAQQPYAQAESIRLMQLYHQRVITYPDTYVPVLVSKADVPALRVKLGPRFLVLSPRLQ